MDSEQFMGFGAVYGFMGFSELFMKLFMGFLYLFETWSKLLILNGHWDIGPNQILSRLNFPEIVSSMCIAYHHIESTPFIHWTL